MPPTTETPGVCPHCGADVPARAQACPDCGADSLTGWSDSPDDAGGTPGGYGYEDDFGDDDYDEFLRREGLVPDDRPISVRLGEHRTAIIAGILAVVAFVVLVLR